MSFQTIIMTTFRRKLCQKMISGIRILAWNLSLKLHAKLLKSLKNIIFSDDFLLRNRKSKKDFTRKRSLPFPLLILFMANFLKGAIQDELNWFFKTVKGNDLPKTEISASAFFQARKKLKHKAFVELNRHQVDYFYNHFSPNKWNGYRLIGVDGSTIRLPDSKEIVEHFGVQIAGKGKNCPMGRASQFFDPLNKITVDATIDPITVDERTQLAAMLPNFGPKDILLLDRGYPSFGLFALLLSKNIPFVCRLTVSTWKSAKELVQSKEKETIAMLKPSDQARKTCKKYGLSVEPINLRFVRIDLPSGDPEVLVTSLLDPVKFPHSDFSGLYQLRWPVETDFSYLKCRLEVERFTGVTVISVLQDFHAKVFAKNLTLMLAFKPNNRVKKAKSQRKLKYQLNLTQVFSKMKDTIVLLFIRRKIMKPITELFEIFMATRLPIRPGRVFPRNHRSPRRYSNTYKPIR
jgi:hypothetical protein